MSKCCICKTNCSSVKLAIFSETPTGRTRVEYASVNCLRNQKKTC